MFSDGLDGIQDQIHGDLLELGRVRADAADVPVEIEFHLNRIGDGAAVTLGLTCTVRRWLIFAFN